MFVLITLLTQKDFKVVQNQTTARLRIYNLEWQNKRRGVMEWN
jgi:hypothetical protein